MQVQKHVRTASPRPVQGAPSVAYFSAERTIQRQVELRSMTAVDQMFAYFGTDLA